MLNLIQADLFKMHKSMAIKILFSITTISALAMTVLAYLLEQGQIDAGMIGIGFMFSDVNMVSILGAVLAGVFICGDFDNKTIHDAISSGSSRGTVIVSKAIVFFCGIGFILLPYAIVTGIALWTGFGFNMGAVSVGFLNNLTQASTAAFQASNLLKFLLIALILIIVYASQLSVCVPLAFILKKPVLVVPIYYVISLLGGQLSLLAASSPGFNRIFSLTPFGGSYSFLDLNAQAADIFKAILVSVIFIIIMLAITYAAFRKAEIK
ncbi:ABC transporter permease [Acetobacterium paludosum]|uniref:ABC transporter permease n=1 Tax=Acetobacterium paludosum TaxID=52693 RepID=A0A923KVK4_9FIRM|nr:ABC transporter permease [Acetobacterium paludosum]MBC3887555.1 ABC transporter permease [Acetobacterium paludosum]